MTVLHHLSNLGTKMRPITNLLLSIHRFKISILNYLALTKESKRALKKLQTLPWMERVVDGRRDIETEF